MSDRTEPVRAPNGSGAPPAALACLGAAPLYEGEHDAAYGELLARIASAIKPADILEEIWMRDIVDLVWEAFRLRRLKAHLMTRCARKAVRSGLEDTLPGRVKELTRQWAIGDQAARDTIKTTLAAAGLALDDLTAWEFRFNLDDMGRIDRMIMSAEARRHNALRELDRHRAALAQRLTRAVADAEAAAFGTAAAKLSASETAK